MKDEGPTTPGCLHPSMSLSRVGRGGSDARAAPSKVGSGRGRFRSRAATGEGFCVVLLHRYRRARLFLYSRLLVKSSYAEANIRKDSRSATIDVVADFRTERVILGGTGFVGSVIFKAGVSKGIEVTSVSRYCNQYVDRDALMYLILANDILHNLHPNIITIAEDATNYPGLCEPISQGGLGFDYYVNLSAPDMWSSLLQNVPDHEWNMSKIVETLSGNKLYADKMLIYADNHSQSLSGGCSFAEILFGGHENGSLELNSLDRGCSLHKG